MTLTPSMKTYSNINSSRIQLYGFNKRGLEVITWPVPNPKVKESEGLGVQDIITRPLPANKDYFQQGVVAFIRHIVRDGESTPHNFTLYHPILCQGHFSGAFYQVAFE